LKIILIFACVSGSEITHFNLNGHETLKRFEAIKHGPITAMPNAYYE